MAIAGLFLGAAPRGASDLPAAAPPASEPARPSDPDAEAIEARSICIGSTVHSAGELGPALLYRSARLPDGRVAVGYYAFFSEERPWGNNWMTWTVLPALAVDMVYTRGLLVGPGLQRARYGLGDVEGFRIIYTRGPGGELVPERAVADDDTHQRADLSPEELFAVDPGRITLSTASWSHHLGARVRGRSDLVWHRCYEKGAIRPLDGDAARRFKLDRRAYPAAV
jgi:hypothetical protein